MSVQFVHDFGSSKICIPNEFEYEATQSICWATTKATIFKKDSCGSIMFKTTKYGRLFYRRFLSLYKSWANLNVTFKKYDGYIYVTVSKRTSDCPFVIYNFLRMYTPFLSCNSGIRDCTNVVNWIMGKKRYSQANRAASLWIYDLYRRSLLNGSCIPGSDSIVAPLSIANRKAIKRVSRKAFRDEVFFSETRTFKNTLESSDYGEFKFLRFSLFPDIPEMDLLNGESSIFPGMKLRLIGHVRTVIHNDEAVGNLTIDLYNKVEFKKGCHFLGTKMVDYVVTNNLKSPNQVLKEVKQCRL